MSTRRIRSAGPKDMLGIHALLEDNGLPVSDLDSSGPEFVVACEGAEIVGTGAIQHLGAAGLLRHQ